MRTGRPKGAKNKITASVKENIVAVFTRLGGTAGMAIWAAANPSEFYRLYGRLAPTQVEVDVEYRDANSLTDAELAAIATGSSQSVVDAPGGEAELTQVH